MTEFNPYAAPEDDSIGRGPGEVTGDGVWREGKLLVMEKRAELPPRCVKCNAPATGKPLKRKLYWHAPGWYALVLLNLLFYAVVALLVRKTATIHVGLCDRHRGRRRMWIGIAWSMVIAAIAMPFALIPVGEDAVIAAVAATVILLLAAALTGLYGARVVHATKIDDIRAWVAGVCPAYLAELPGRASV